MMYKRYTEEERIFLQDFYPDHTRLETLAEYNKRFDEITESQLKHRLKKFGIKNNKDTRYGSNHEPWNKGISIKNDYPDMYEMYKMRNHSEFCESSKATWFKSEPIGTEKIHDGRVYVKIGNPSKWKPKTRYMYEKYHNVKLGNADKIIHLNGDKNDFSKDNLECISVNIQARLNRLHMNIPHKELMRITVTNERILERIREHEKTTSKE